MKKEPLRPITVYEDNQSAINMIKNPQRSKHVDLKYRFVRNKARKGSVNTQYCRTEDMLADTYVD